MGQNTIITMGVFDKDARSASTFSVSDAQSFSNRDQLRSDAFTFEKYATLEQDFFLLDGSFEALPEEYDSGWWKYENGIGWWSRSMSGKDGAFASPPELEIDLLNDGKTHATTGLTLTFDADYPLELTVDWYGESGLLVHHGVYQPDSLVFFCPAKVSNFKRIVVTFTRTKPYRYIKVQRIDYGTNYTWGTQKNDEKVISASILEEVDPVSAELSINTMDFELYSNKGSFDLFDPDSLLSAFSENQRVEVTQVMDGEEIPMGTYYLDSWANDSEDTGTFTAISPIGILDKTNFNGDIYKDKTAKDIIDSIMDSAGWTDYEIADELQQAKLSGWIPICTHREALQQVAFALRAVVEDNRGNTIHIRRNLRSYGRLIPRGRKIEGGTLTLDSYVSGITVTAHDYMLSDKAEEVWSGSVADGIYKVEFNSPCANVDAVAVPFEDEFPCANCQYVRFSHESPGTYKEKISGNKYEDCTTLFPVKDKDIGGKGKTLSVTDATLVSRTNAQEVADHLMEYYRQRYKSSLEIVVDKESAGERVAVQSSNGLYYQIFTILSMDIDLVGGFLAKIEMVSDGKKLVLANYTGEFYAGERGLI